MKILVIGPPLYGLLYPVVSLAHAFRSNGHDVVLATGGAMTEQVIHAGLPTFNAAPGLDPDAEYRRQEASRKQRNLGTKPGGFAFFSEEMSDNLVEFTRAYQPDLIVYPPLGVAARLLGSKFGIPTVLQTVGFAHQPTHVNTVTRALEPALRRHGVPHILEAPHQDLRWIDVAPPSMSVLDYPKAEVVPMRYVPYNGGTELHLRDVHAEDEQGQRRILVSLGTLKPMVDGLDLISWITKQAEELDAQFTVQLRTNARAGLPAQLPANVQLVDWLGPDAYHQADLFIHHGGAGNTFTALSHAIPQVIFGEGADRPHNAAIVRNRGCGVLPPETGLSAEFLRGVMGDEELRRQAHAVAAELAAMPAPATVAAQLSDLVRAP
ncbi:nucleotide disphospho-sugar-binding domain-containing protein [Corynebacterium hindlerae]|uniref:nucleotide disphospho-sugar-binding domain-containing protein n=1 Tax=Corynebacterium hindlerae TaxID=699041 RepID=UPI0031B6DBA9